MGRFDGLDDEEIEGTIGGHNPRFVDDDDDDDFDDDDEDFEDSEWE